MNWAAYALGVSAALIGAWLWLAWRRQWTWPGLYASLGCLIAACFNAAAPVRGLLDRDYVGFQFGMVGSAPGIGVTLLAGTIFLLGAISALLGASRAAGKALWLLAAYCTAMFVIIGVPTLQQSVQNPAANSIQFGEYLTIPGMVGTAILILLMAVPFAVGAVWGAGAATTSRN